jgi:hypothetical protein
MNTLQIPKQIIEFNKMTIDKSLENMMLLQDQSQRFTSGLLDKSVWMPEEGKKAINDWMKSYKKSFEGMKAASDEGYKMMSKIFSNGEEVVSKNQKSAE